MNRYDSDDEIAARGVVLIMIAVVLGLASLGYAIHACSVMDQATIGKAEIEVQRKNFEESEAYQAGIRRDFDELMLSYVHAKSEDEKSTVMAVIRHRAEGVRPDLVPQDVKNLLERNKR